MMAARERARNYCSKEIGSCKEYHFHKLYSTNILPITMARLLVLIHVQAQTKALAWKVAHYI